MADKTIIAWTDYTFNPWMGCTKVSAGCKNCYAENLTSGRMGIKNLWGDQGRRQITSAANWKKPLTWQKRATIEGKSKLAFCASLCDVFEDHFIANTKRPELWELIKQCDMLEWQVLTKRPENILRMLPKDWGEGYSNVWLGVSVEDMRVAHRADILRRVPAKIRFISYEPAIGPLDKIDLTKFQWVIYGGESGPKFRNHNVQWARDMNRKCKECGVNFFYKQGAAFRTEMHIELDGRIIRTFPDYETPAQAPPKAI